MNTQNKDQTTEMDAFFCPESVAVVGASRDSEKIGHAILKNILESGYDGDIKAMEANLAFDRLYPTLGWKGQV